MTLMHGLSPHAGHPHPGDTGISAAERLRLAARTRGVETAAITVLELSDFQCGDCRRFSQEVFPTIERRHLETGKIRWIFLNWPKSAKHPNARRAAEYALAAAHQGRFWSMHDRLFATFDEWAELGDPDGSFDASARAVGLDERALRRYLLSDAPTAELDADAEYIARWRVEYVPSFNIGGLVMTGRRPADYWSGVIDSMLHGLGPHEHDE